MDCERERGRERAMKGVVGNERNGTNEVRGGERKERKCLGWKEGKIKIE